MGALVMWVNITWIWFRLARIFAQIAGLSYFKLRKQRHILLQLITSTSRIKPPFNYEAVPRWTMCARVLSRVCEYACLCWLYICMFMGPCLSILHLLNFIIHLQGEPSSIFITGDNFHYFGYVDGLPFPDTGCPVPDVSIYYMSIINELPDGLLFHWFCKCTPPWMFLPLDIPSEYRPEHVTFGLLCVIFKFPSRIFCRRVPGFATDCPCGVWCRGLTTCLLYVGPLLEF